MRFKTEQNETQQHKIHSYSATTNIHDKKYTSSPPRCVENS